MHDALLDYMDKIRDPFRSYHGACVRGVKMHSRAGWGHFVPPTRWLFASSTRL